MGLFVFENTTCRLAVFPSNHTETARTTAAEKLQVLEKYLQPSTGSINDRADPVIHGVDRLYRLFRDTAIAYSYERMTCACPP